MQGTEAYHKYVRDFMSIQFPAGDVPRWAVDALATADIHIDTTLPTEEAAAAAAGSDVNGGSGTSTAVEGADAVTLQSGYKRKLDSTAGEV